MGKEVKPVSNPTPFPPEFLKQVRTACKHYDKPERIGQLPLAAVALRAALLQDPAHPTDPAGRGRALQAAVDAGLTDMTPQERHTRQDEVYLSLHCYVYGRDPYTDTKVEQVAAYLEAHYYLAKATYHLRQKEGLERLGLYLSAHLAERTTWLEPIPLILESDFVGRVDELADYGARLRRNRLAVIEGVGGVGKTTLAARLAAASPTGRPVCWLTLRPGLNDDAASLVHAWAAFLAQHGSPQLWALLRASAAESRPPADLFPALRAGLAAVGPLLCLDNLETAEADPFWSLLEMVQDVPQAALLLISRRRPPLPRLGDYPLLDGLSPAEVTALLTQRGLELTLAQAEKVGAHTQGNPRLIELWAARARQSLRPGQELNVEAALAGLTESRAVAHYLAHEVAGALSPGQRRAAGLLACSRRLLDGFLLQHPPPELPLDDLELAPEDFAGLQAQGLVQVGPGEGWQLSPLLSDYMGGRTPAEQRGLCHRWLARWYALQGDTLEAAYHAARGGEVERAVLLLAENQHRLIEQGQAPAVRRVLDPLSAESLSAPVRQVWRELRGRLLRLAGEYAAAQAEAQAAAQEAETAIARAQAERARGEAAKRLGDVWGAAEHYQDALRLLTTDRASLAAWLHRDLAWSLMEQHNLEAAWNEAQRARIALENTLGVIARRQGDFEQARVHLEQAAALARQGSERRELARALNNLAALYDNRGWFEQAIARYQETLHIVEEIGERVGQAITRLNMGICYLELGDPQAAVEHERRALSLFQELGDVKGQLLAQTSLAEAHLRAGQLSAARQQAQAALQADERLMAPADYAEAQRVYAEVLLAQGELDAALAAAQRALELLSPPQADEFSEPFYVALTCQTLARVHDARGEADQAQACRDRAQRIWDDG